MVFSISFLALRAHRPTDLEGNGDCPHHLGLKMTLNHLLKTTSVLRLWFFNTGIIWDLEAVTVFPVRLAGPCFG